MRTRVPHLPLRSLAALGVVLASIAACAGESERRGRVLLVGIDGATLRIVRPMLREGRLPNLRRIATQGVAGALRAHYPLNSPRVWNSIATGKGPRQHGILDFARPGDDGERRLYLASDRKVHALWNIVSDAGRSVGVVNWWTTYPPAAVNGVIVSDHLLTQEIEGRRRLTRAEGVESGPIAWPPAWQARVEALVAEDAALTDLPDPFADTDAFAPWMEPERLSRRYHNDAVVTRIALAVEEELRPDLLLVFLPGIDRVSHRLWATVEPPEAYERPLAMTSAQRAAGREALHAYYDYTDALIGRLAAGFGADDLVMVVSDHGFEAGMKLLTLTGIHKTEKALHGVVFARGPGVVAPDAPAPVSVNDVAPTILAWMGLPIAEDMQGRIAPFLRVTDVARVATHDTGAIQRAADAPSGSEEEILEQLEALGYLERDDSD